MNNNYPGKLIVIDGTDGAGKTTQLKKLKEKLLEENFQVMEADFPQYNTKSAGLVEEYLSGKYGTADEVSPYQSSIFYAVDRFDAKEKIISHLKKGAIVLSNRYVSSSLGHQGGKIDDPLERKAFFNWLYELEYKIFCLPKPDLSLILYVEPEIAQNLSKKRQREDWKGKTKDIHEDNLEHLKKAANVFKEIAESFSNFKFINCTKNNEIMNIDDIHYLVLNQVKNILNKDIDEKKIDKKNDLASISDVLTKNGDFNKFNKQNFTVNNNDSKSKEAEIYFEKLDKEVKAPLKAHLNDAGFDLFANESVSIEAYSQENIKTGIKIAIPENYVGLIWDKSGLANLGYKTMGGVIDSGYFGEIKVIFKNLSEDIVHIKKGQKIAQLLIQKVENFNLKEKPIDNISDRQDKGFGSSGLF